MARLVASRADAIVAASEAIAEETRSLAPALRRGDDRERLRLRRLRRLEHHASPRFRITHAGSFFGRRDPRPFLTALAESGLDAVARFVGDFRAADREWAETLGLGDRLELHEFGSRRRALELQRDSEALLLLIPEAGGRGKGVLSGKVFEYLAAERPILAAVPPDGAAAALIRETGPASSRRPTTPGDRRGAAVAPRALAGRLARRHAAPAELRRKLDRRTRVRELADLLQDLE